MYIILKNLPVISWALFTKSLLTVSLIFSFIYGLAKGETFESPLTPNLIKNHNNYESTGCKSKYNLLSLFFFVNYLLILKLFLYLHS
nr:MAG TPA: hypothetical protein [Herelleviridae sp.]